MNLDSFDPAVWRQHGEAANTEASQATSDRRQVRYMSEVASNVRLLAQCETLRTTAEQRFAATGRKQRLVAGEQQGNGMSAQPSRTSSPWQKSACIRTPLHPA